MASSKRLSKRLSVADRQFLQFALGNVVDIDADSWYSFSDDCCDFSDCLSSAVSPERTAFFIGDDEEEAAFGNRRASAQFLQGLNFDDWQDVPLESIYEFDLAKVAEALRNGASPEELALVFEESMVDSLELRLRGSSAVTGDLTSGLMTPPLEKESPGIDAATLAAKLASARTSLLRRRSSIGLQLMQAVKDASERQQTAEERVEASVPAQSAQSRRHRLSLLRSAEVIEAAANSSAGDSAVEDSEVLQARLETVEKALETARRRHRLSIVKAVEEVSGSSDIAVVICEDSARVQRVIAAAYAKKAESLNQTALLNTWIGPSGFVHCGPKTGTKSPERRACRARR